MRSAHLVHVLLYLGAYGSLVAGSPLCAKDDLDKVVFLQSKVSTSSDRAEEDEKIAADENDETAWFGKAHTTSGNTRWMSLTAWLTYTIVAACYAWWGKSQEHSQQSVSSDTVEKVRDHHLDVAKAWFMMLVVWTHLPKQRDLAHFDTLPYQMFIRFEMPGFSFVSGLNAASIVHQPAWSKDSTLQNKQLLHRFRDLILANFTCPPLTVMLCVLLRCFAMLSTSPLTSVGYTISALPLLKIPSTWGYWFLPTLFLWYLIAPTFRLLKFPLTLSLMTSIFSGSNDGLASKVLTLFPFFVAGFLLGGGGLLAEERTECRAKFAKYAKSMSARLIALALLGVWFTVLTNLLPHLPACMTYPGYLTQGTVLQWAQGGAPATLISICTSMLGVMVSLVMCFAVPDSVAAFVGKVGSRTLYIYLLHDVVITDLHFNERGQMMIPWWQFQSVYIRSLLLGSEAVWITALFGSDLSVKLTHHFVQPQWLLNFITLYQPS